MTLTTILYLFIQGIIFFYTDTRNHLFSLLYFYFIYTKFINLNCIIDQLQTMYPFVRSVLIEFLIITILSVLYVSSRHGLPNLINKSTRG